MPNNPENMALLALMLLHDSRRDARSTDDGQLILLEEQNRSLWRHDQIAEGIRLVERALGRRNLGPYQLQAAIAAIRSDFTKYTAVGGTVELREIRGVRFLLRPGECIEHRCFARLAGRWPSRSSRHPGGWRASPCRGARRRPA